MSRDLYPTYDGIERYKGEPFWRNKDMTPARAKEVLEGMKLFTFNSDNLENNSNPYILTHVFGMELDGKFTADQLEAIACWMREPKAVVEA